MATFKRNTSSLPAASAQSQPAHLTSSTGSAQVQSGNAVKNTNGAGNLYGATAVGNTVNEMAPNSNTDKESQNCFCFESDDDSAERIRIRNTKKKIARNCVGNIAISILLIFYTLIGAIIFLIVEGGSGMNVRRSESRNKVNSNSENNSSSNGYLAMSTGLRSWNGSVSNSTAELLSVIGDGPRTHTVENIWDITVSLNILYRENWTRLAGQELNSFQEMIVQRILQEMHSPGGSTVAAVHGAGDSRMGDGQHIIEWNLAKSFLYALTVLTTIGFGSFGPKTAVGKAVTMGYAALGIPLMLIYLTSMGTLLSDCARGVFTRSLCCCLCSNCGYCCYDENRMMEKERRMRRKREMREQERHQMEPFYVRSPSTTFTTASATNNLHSPNRQESNSMLDALKLAPAATSTATATPSSDLPGNYDSNSTLNGNTGGSCLAPILLSLIVITIYLCGGAVILCRLETSWSYLDSLFFCFMTLSTIGSGDTIPSRLLCSNKKSTDLTIWFCSVYIIVGMALTAMSFNIFYCEIVKKFQRRRQSSTKSLETDLTKTTLKNDKNNIVSVVDGDLLTNTTTTSYSVNNSFDFITNS